MGVFLVISAIGLWIFSILMRAIQSVLNAPKTIAIYQEKSHHKKGLQALAYGLSAVAAGDIRMADYYTKRVRRFLKNDFGLTALLEGLSARLSGNEKQAHKSFQKLLNHPETSFLGLKALLQTALDKGDLRYARILVERAYDRHPKQSWVLQSYYDLETQSGRYDNALALLKKMVANDVFNKDQVNRERAALYLAQHDFAKAYKASSKSLPVCLEYLSALAEKNKRRKSINIIQNIWRYHPHSQLLDFWIKYAPKKAISNPNLMASWIEDLYHMNSDSAACALYCGESLVKLRQPDQAKRFINTAITLKPTMRAYQIMHQIDPIGGWINNVPNAHPDECWICTRTRKIYSKWQPVSDGKYFNTIIWTYPDGLSNQLSNHDHGTLNNLL